MEFRIIFAIEILCSIGSYFFYPRLIIRDDALGWKYIPTKKKITRNFSKDIAYDLYINSQGFRDDEFRKNKSCFKIMVLGDSMTFGMEVNQEDIFCNVLERKLKSTHPGRNIDVMNFGITGFSTAQELLCLKKYGDVYNPNIVILMLFEPNDFSDNPLVISSGRYHPHFIIESGKLKLYNKPSLLQHTVTFFRDKSFLVYFMSNRIKSGSTMLTQKVILNEQDNILLMKGILTEMHNYTKQKNIPFFIFYITNKATGNSKYVSIEKFCEERAIPLKEILLLKTERFYSGHWNKEGNNSVAEIIFRELSGYKVLDMLTDR